MPVKPESHHHTCPGSTDHHCPGCCSCECCGGYRKYYLPPPDDQSMDLSSDDASTWNWNTPQQQQSSNSLFSSPQQNFVGSPGQQPFAGFGSPQQQQQQSSNSLFSSPQDTGGSMFGQYPCKMAGCDKRFTSMNSMVKHQQKNHGMFPPDPDLPSNTRYTGPLY